MLPVILLIVLFFCVAAACTFLLCYGGNDPLFTVAFRRGTGGISGALERTWI